MPTKGKTEMKTEFAPVLLTGDAHRDSLRGVVQPDDLKALQSRNKHRAQAAIKAMGPAWCCSRNNRVPRGAPEPTIAEIQAVSRMLGNRAMQATHF
jgi:hypothetical protein